MMCQFEGTQNQGRRGPMFKGWGGGGGGARAVFFRQTQLVKKCSFFNCFRSTFFELALDGPAYMLDHEDSNNITNFPTGLNYGGGACPPLPRPWRQCTELKFSICGYQDTANFRSYLYISRRKLQTHGVAQGVGSH